MKQVVDCYQCEFNKSVEEFWPFCSEGCKKEYANSHYIRKEHKYQTIKQCQDRLKELKEEKHGKEHTNYDINNLF
jgi:endogenous inhibitor of DNA gyrase (YacG/DUF329 family)